MKVLKDQLSAALDELEQEADKGSNVEGITPSVQRVESLRVPDSAMHVLPCLHCAVS